MRPAIGTGRVLRRGRGDAQGVDGGEQSGRVEGFAERCCGCGDRVDEGLRVEDVPRSVVAAADEIAASAGDASVVFGEPCADLAVDRMEVAVVAAGCPVWCVGRFHGCAVLLEGGRSRPVWGRWAGRPRTGRGTGRVRRRGVLSATRRGRRNRLMRGRVGLGRRIGCRRAIRGRPSLSRRRRSGSSDG